MQSFQNNLNGSEPLEKKNLLIWILVVGVFGILNTEMGVIGILPYVSSSYNVDLTTAGLMISLFALGVGIAGPTMPLIFSRFPRKKIMLLVLAIFTVSNTISIFTTNFDTLLILRVIPSFFHPVYCAMAFSVAAEIGGKNAPKEVAKINIGVSAGMVVGVPISNFLAEQITLAASMAFFAVVTAIALIATIIFIPPMKQQKPLSYGSQLNVLKQPMVWASIFAVIFLNGSVFGCFNYLAAYLTDVTKLAPSMVSIVLFVYGVCNIFGSMIAGNLLTVQPIWTVKLFPIALSIIYLILYFGGSTIVLSMLILTIIWGILGGVNANINQYWLSHFAPEAPDFANGLFLTSANVGTMTATAFCGLFIDKFSIEEVILGGLIFSFVSLLIVWFQCYKTSVLPFFFKG